MRLLSLFRKALLENVRDWKILVITVFFAPLFVFLMYFSFTGAPQTYTVMFVDNDTGVTLADGQALNAGDELFASMEAAHNTDGTSILTVVRMNDSSDVDRRLIDKSADLAIEVPQNFTAALMDYRDGKSQTPAVIESTGNPSNAKYAIAAGYGDLIAYTYAANVTGAPFPVDIWYDTVDAPGNAGTAASRSQFDLMVPGLLALSFIILMFTTAASFVREKDKGTIVRLKLSGMRVYEFIASVGMVQVLIGIVALALTFLCAMALGFHSSGSLLTLLAIGILTSLSIIAISLVVVPFLRSMFDLLTIGCIPIFVLMFFSGGMIPLPPVPLFSIAGHTFNANDVLPTTHAIAAIDKVLNYGQEIGDIGFELAAIAILTAIYLAIGMWLFRRRYLKVG